MPYICSITMTRFQWKLWVISLWTIVVSWEAMSQDAFSYQTRRLTKEEQTQASIEEWMQEQFGSYLQLSPIDTQLTPWSEHIRFEIQIQGVPIHHAWVKWNRSIDGIQSMSYPVLPTEMDISSNLSGAFDRSLLTNINTLDGSILKSNIQWIKEDNSWTTRWVIWTDANDGYTEVVLDELGRPQSSIDLVKGNVDTLARVNIYLPDPVTASGTSYGAPYVDNDDEASSALIEAMSTGLIPLRFKDFSAGWYLESDYLVAHDSFAPFIDPPFVAELDSANLFVDRSDPRFEYFNASYHMHSARQQYKDLGFDVVDFPLHYDAHGREIDQSSYTPNDDFPYLRFGVGGVDDAEDAEVIVHEYGHAVIHSIAPNTSYGAERDALDEGMCDYLALSYSARITNQNRNTIFDWDAHNEFWSGRTLTNSRTYPTDLQNDLYADGILWVSALAEIADLIGHETTDQVALHSIYSWYPFMKLSDATGLVVRSDSILNQGVNHDAITSVFCVRGLLPGCEDTLISSLPIAEPFLGNSFDFSFNNEPLFIYTNRTPLVGLEVYDINGRFMHSETWESEDGNVIPWKAEILPQGIFVIRLLGESSSHSFKVVKLW